MNQIVAVIPARMASSRYPGKPLAPLLGRPMIEHVIRRARMCDLLDVVYVATCDDEIRIVSEALDCEVIMTSRAHARASDRVAEAAEKIGSDIVVMIQGDEPMITPGMIEAAIGPILKSEQTACTNLVREIVTEQEYLDPNTIKVVMDRNGDALYFSRAPIPAINFAGSQARVLKQVCVIAFRREFLRQYTSLAPTPLEVAESIDMLRVLKHGARVRLVETAVQTHAVDTPADLRFVETLMKDDPLVLAYAQRAARVEAAG